MNLAARAQTPAPILRTASGEPPLGYAGMVFRRDQGEAFEPHASYAAAGWIGVIEMEDGKWLAQPPGFRIDAEQFSSRDVALRTAIARMIRKARRYARAGEGEGTHWSHGFAGRVIEWALSLKVEKDLNQGSAAVAVAPSGHPGLAGDAADSEAGVTDDGSSESSGALIQNSDPIVRSLCEAHRARKIYPAGHTFAMTNPVVNGHMVTLGTCSCGDVFSYPYGKFGHERMDAAIEAHWQKFDHLPDKTDGRGEPITQSALAPAMAADAATAPDLTDPPVAVAVGSRKKKQKKSQPDAGGPPASNIADVCPQETLRSEPASSAPPDGAGSPVSDAQICAASIAQEMAAEPAEDWSPLLTAARDLAWQEADWRDGEEYGDGTDDLPSPPPASPDELENLSTAAVTILVGDCRALLKTLPDNSIHCVVTSPPYWGLRDYGVEPTVWGGDEGCEHDWGGEIAVNATNHTDKARWNHTRNGRDEEQPTEKRVSWLRTKVKQGKFCQRCGAWAGAHGLEPDYRLYVENEVRIFAEVRRVLRPDGTLWLNLGDSYATGAGKVDGAPGGGEQGERWRGGHEGKHGVAWGDETSGIGPMTQPNRMPQFGLKAKDLCGMPWRVAFALQADGWYLRQDVVWSKLNPMPESVRDRCTKSHEYLFLLSKSERYHFDADAIAEPVSLSTVDRMSQPSLGQQQGSDRVPGKTNGAMKAVLKRSGNKERKPASARGVPIDTDGKSAGAVADSVPWEGSTRNKRSVWTVMTQPFSEAHFATFPPALIEPCILAGCPEGGVVLDPFGGAGTTGLVADRLKRRAVLLELNPAYAAMAARRIKGDAGIFAEVEVKGDEATMALFDLAQFDAANIPPLGPSGN